MGHNPQNQGGAASTPALLAPHELAYATPSQPQTGASRRSQLSGRGVQPPIPPHVAGNLQNSVELQSPTSVQVVAVPPVPLVPPGPPVPPEPPPEVPPDPPPETPPVPPPPEPPLFVPPEPPVTEPPLPPSPWFSSNARPLHATRTASAASAATFK